MARQEIDVMKLRYYLAVILATSSGGFTGVLVKWLHIAPLPVTFFRLAVPSVVLFCYLKFKGVKVFGGNYKILSLASFLNGGRLFLYYLAYFYTSVAYGVVVLYTYPVFLTVFGVLFLKEKITRRTAGLIAVAFLGTVIISAGQWQSFSARDIIGLSAMLLSAIIFSVSMFIFKKESVNHSEAEMVFWQNIVGAVVALAVMSVFGLHVNAYQAVWAVLYYGLFIGVLTFLLFFYALKRLKLSHYSVLTYWEVVSGVLFAVILLGEKITVNFVIGGLMIIGAGIGLVLEKNSKIEIDPD